MGPRGRDCWPQAGLGDLGERDGVGAVLPQAQQRSRPLARLSGGRAVYAEAPQGKVTERSYSQVSIVLAVFIRNDYVNQILILLLATCSGLNIAYLIFRAEGIRNSAANVPYDPTNMSWF